jgi:hypothetical protein
MSPADETLTEFESKARTVLEASCAAIDGRTRSRLNQARQAALAAAARPHRTGWRSLTFMPAAGAVAAALVVSVLLWHREPSLTVPAEETARSNAVEDMDLLADSDGIDLMEGWDGSFYEWAAAQSDAGESEG